MSFPYDVAISGDQQKVFSHLLSEDSNTICICSDYDWADRIAKGMNIYHQWLTNLAREIIKDSNDEVLGSVWIKKTSGLNDEEKSIVWNQLYKILEGKDNDTDSRR